MAEVEHDTTLWREQTCQAWHEALDRYAAVVEAQGSEKLINLDKWYREELPRAVSQRREQEQQPCIYLDDLQGVASWKMSRGVWRERNRILIATNAPEAVIEASRKALASIPDPRAPITALCVLAGVGPATASAVLAAYAPETYPFFDELVATQVPTLGPVVFTVPYYLAYAAAIRERASQLSASCAHKMWTPQDVSQALWASAGGKAAAGSRREAC